MSVFRGEVAMLGSGGVFIGLQPGKAERPLTRPSCVSPKRWLIRANPRGVIT
jgi:hypothetical protein